MEGRERFGYVVMTGRYKILDYDRLTGGQRIATADDLEAAQLIRSRLNGFDSLADEHAILTEQRDRLAAALRQIAAFDDEQASHKLEETGSYGWFDEPGAVQVARAAIAAVEQGGES